MERPIKPYDQVKAMLGDASPAWEKLVGRIRFSYALDEIWIEGNPNHKNHNNLYFKRGGKTLVTLSIREGYFIVCIVFGKAEREKFDDQRDLFSEAICKEYDAAHTYHDGKWLGFEVRDKTLVGGIIRLLPIKRKPNRHKMFPASLELCGRLDLGLSHEEISSRLIPLYPYGKAQGLD